MPDQIASWLNQPFRADMSATRWFLFLGLLMVLLWAWHMVFRELAAVEGSVT